MAFADLLALTQKQFLKKNPDADVEFRAASEEPPPTGILAANPLLEFLLDRRFLAQGRFILVYGKKGSMKTTLFYDLAKFYQRNGGDVVWIETEHAIDLDYARKQGVDLTKVAVLHPDSLEQALQLGEMTVKNMPKAYPDGDTPVLIALDSIAGTAPAYETDPSHTFTDVQPGLHARLMGRFFREMEKPLANERCVFLLLNQLKSKIGAMGYGEDSADALIGGEAQFFHSTYHMKMSKVAELTAPVGDDGVTRKVGSVHKIVCKRNKLGREGKNQEVEVDLYIDGGIDWWSPLVRKLGKDSYTSVLSKAGGYYYWKVPNLSSVDPQTKVSTEISTDQAYRESELGILIKNCPAAQDCIRQAFGIPALPEEKEVAELEVKRKKKRKQGKTEEPEPVVRQVALVEA